MQWQTVEEPLLCYPQSKYQIYRMSQKRGILVVQMAITPSEIGKFSINDGGKSTKEASLGCCIMYGRHYHITLVCGWFLIWWPTIYRWKTIVLLYNWRLTMQCYEADWMVLGVLSKTNWLSLDGKLYFWNRSMAIHSQRAGDAQLIMGQIQC